MNIEKNLTDDQCLTVWALLFPEEREEAIDKIRGYISRAQVYDLKDLKDCVTRRGSPDIGASIRRLIAVRCQLN